VIAIDASQLPAASAVAMVARSSATQPEFVLADGPPTRFVAARWRRRKVRLDGPVQLEQHLLSYCERGGAVSTVVADGVQLRVRQHTGAVTFLPAGCYERWQLEATGEVVHVHLYIAAEALREVLDASTPAIPSLPLMDVRDAWFDSFFRLLLAEIDACRARGQLQSIDLLDRLGDLLLRRLLGLHRPAAGPAERAQVAPLRPFLLREVLNHIERHLPQRLTLDTLAAMSSMSADHFVRAFERATGSTPHRWILERRLDAACERLRATTAPIDDVAHACGFAHPAHFSATFRRHRGVTPSAYRRGS
jgi:AraC family transcriptional regulator